MMTARCRARQGAGIDDQTPGRPRHSADERARFDRASIREFAIATMARTLIVTADVGLSGADRGPSGCIEMQRSQHKSDQSVARVVRGAQLISPTKSRVCGFSPMVQPAGSGEERHKDTKYRRGNARSARRHHDHGGTVSMKHGPAIAKVAFIIAASASLLTTTTSVSAQGLRDLIGDQGESRGDLRDLIQDRLATREDLRDLLKDRLERRKDLRDLIVNRLASREDLRDLLGDRLERRKDLRDLIWDRSAGRDDLRDLLEGPAGDAQRSSRPLLDRLASREDLRDLLRDRLERRKDLRDLILDRLASCEDLRDLLRDSIGEARRSATPHFGPDSEFKR